jgi:hypothetical protein
LLLNHLDKKDSMVKTENVGLNIFPVLRALPDNPRHMSAIPFTENQTQDSTRNKPDRTAKILTGAARDSGRTRAGFSERRALSTVRGRLGE